MTDTPGFDVVGVDFEPQKHPATTPRTHARGTETETIRYQRQTRNATVFIAWTIGIFALLALIGGIIGVAEIIHAFNATNATSNCIPNVTC